MLSGSNSNLQSASQDRHVILCEHADQQKKKLSLKIQTYFLFFKWQKELEYFKHCNYNVKH
jgi:hypothetical protein